MLHQKAGYIDADRSSTEERLADRGRTIHFFVGYDAKPVRNPVHDATDVPDLGSWLIEDKYGRAKFARMFGGAKGVTRAGLFVDADRAQRFADELTRTHDRDWYAYQLWRVDEVRGAFREPSP